RRGDGREPRDAARLRLPPRRDASGGGEARGRSGGARDPHPRRMSIVLYRVDDRLIHGQVVVGWGQPLEAGFIVLVDDEVRASEWEQDLYRMGVPPHIEVVFASVEEARRRLGAWNADPRSGILLARDIDTFAAIVGDANRSEERRVGKACRSRKST